MQTVLFLDAKGHAVQTYIYKLMIHRQESYQYVQEDTHIMYIFDKPRTEDSGGSRVYVATIMRYGSIILFLGTVWKLLISPKQNEAAHRTE